MSIQAFAAIAQRRLRSQRITRPARRDPAEVVAWMGAVQAQEYKPAKWALALRMKSGAVDSEIEQAFEEGRILRTHLMRPTWHFVAPSDIRWLTELTAPRVHRIMSSYNRRLELDAPMLVRATALIEHVLRDRKYLTRPELGERLRQSGVSLDGVRLGQLMMYTELEGVVCSGPRRGKQFTYALVAERAPAAVRLSRDEALATLSRQYFSSHGPATIRDFVWWSGLTTVDAKRGLEMNRARRDEVGGLTYWTIGPAPREQTRDRGDHLVQLLPIYDEYLIAYRDREAVPHGASLIGSAVDNPVTFQHALVIAGQVAGAWRTRPTSKAMLINVVPRRKLTRAERSAVVHEAQRFGQFVGGPTELSIRR